MAYTIHRVSLKLFAVSGEADPSLAGYLTMVAAATGAQEPTVAVTLADGRVVLVHKEADCTVAVFKR